jgi:hypothetical protein
MTCKTFMRYDGKSVGKAVHTESAGMPPTHEETYSITRVVGDRYFFDVSSQPDVGLDKCRDGRYADSPSRYWKWEKQNYTDNRPSGSIRKHAFQLLETINYEWGGTRGFFLRGSQPPEGEFPEDFRITLRVDPENNGIWGQLDQTRELKFHYGTDYTTKYEIGPNIVSVPAGEFVGCVKSSERFHQDEKEDSPLLWEVQSFWAPGVGKVKEVYRRADGTIVYQLELLRHSPAK